MRGLMRRGAVLAGAVAVLLGSGMGMATASPPRPASGAPAWSITPTPSPSGSTNAALLGVSCRSASACTAVGWYHNNTSLVPLAERWNGKAWAIQATPSPSGARDIRLLGVSCPSASACTAVGDYVNNAGNEVPLAERWHGKAWAIQPTPNPAGSTFTELDGVSCPSASACTAVGQKATRAGLGVTLAEHWNGKTWAIQPTPNPHPGGFGGSALDGVSCTSASACTAVGTYSTFGNNLTLAERWNGTTWAIQPTPNPPGEVELSGVSCTSASACTAVGSSFSGSEGPGDTVAEHWNGTTWTLQPIPTPNGDNGDGEPEAVLNGVSCASASACTAVGWYFNLNIAQVTLAEHWNGTAWAIQRTPGPSGSSLNGVSCTSASACIAAGTAKGGTLAERHGRSS